MLFWLKKAISFWLMPLSVCLVLLVVGWALVLFSRKARRGRVLLTLGLLGLLAISNKWVSNELLAPLESRYPPVPEFVPGQPLPPRVASCRYVVVLGGGNSDIPRLAAVDKLSSSAQARAAEALRLLRVLPHAALILSGPGFPGTPTHASELWMAEASLGARPPKLYLIDYARDTEDEAASVKKIVGDARVALVTSAWHMPRAAALFANAGVDALPCPTDYVSHPGAPFRWGDLGWDVESIDRSTRAIHERIGYLWIWLRGKTVRR